MATITPGGGKPTDVVDGMEFQDGKSTESGKSAKTATGTGLKAWLASGAKSDGVRTKNLGHNDADLEGSRKRKEERTGSNSPVGKRRAEGLREVRAATWEMLAESLSLYTAEMEETFVKYEVVQNTALPLKEACRQIVRIMKMVRNQTQECKKATEAELSNYKERLEDMESLLDKELDAQDDESGKANQAAAAPDSVFCSRCSNKIEEEQRAEVERQKTIAEINTRLEAIKNINDLTEVIERAWPSCMLANVTPLVAPITTSRTARLVVLEEDADDSQEVARALEGQFPSCRAALSLQPGKIGIIKAVEGLQVLEEESGNGEESARFLVVAKLGKGETSKITELDWTTMMKAIGKTIELSGGDIPLVYLSKVRRGPMSHKLIEICRRRAPSGGKLEICAAGGPAGPRPGTGPAPAPASKQDKVNATIRIKLGEGSTFNDVVEKVKGVVKATGGPNGTKVDRFYEQGDCAVIQLTEEEKGAGMKFAGQLKDTVGAEVACRVSSRKSSLVFWSIDPLLDQEGVAKAIKDRFQICAEVEVTAGETRRTKQETWYVVVEMPESLAETILTHRTIQLGHRLCRPERWVHVQLCFRCAKPGHRADKCGELATGTAGSQKRCFKCGSTEHLAKGCAKEVKDIKCPNCEVVGHRADSMACEKYRELVKAARQAKRSSATNEGTAPGTTREKTSRTTQNNAKPQGKSRKNRNRAVKPSPVTNEWQTAGAKATNQA